MTNPKNVICITVLQAYQWPCDVPNRFHITKNDAGLSRLITDDGLIDIDPGDWILFGEDLDPFVIADDLFKKHYKEVEKLND